MIALLLAALSMGQDARIRTGDGTGFVVGKGHGAVGVFRPLSLGVADRTEIGTTGLISLIAPRVMVKQQLTDADDLAVAVTGSLGFPAGGIWAMRTAGILTTDPTVKTPFPVTASAGVAGGLRLDALDLGLSVEGRFGVHPSGWTLDEPGMWFLDPMMAPLTAGPQIKPRLVVELAPTLGDREKLGLRVDSWMMIGAGGPDATLRLMAFWAISPRVLLAAGDAMAWEKREGRPFYAVPIGDLQFRW